MADGYAPLNYSAADEEAERTLAIHKAIELDIIKLVGDTKTQALRSTERQITKFIKEAGSYYRLHNDFETFCEQSVVDIGADRYSRDPSCEVLLLAYGFNDDKVQQWRAAEGQPMPTDLREALYDPYAIKFAWNKPFEYAIYKNVLGIEIPHRNWRDPMIMAMTCSLPGSLGKAGDIIGLPQDLKKDADGKRLIRVFCMPRKATKKKTYTRTYWWMEPEEWEHFCEYNIDDVWSERAMYRRLKPYDLPKHEWELWVIDQEINEAGIPINMQMVDNAAKIYDYVLEDRIAEMAAITGLDNPGSTQQLLPWLQNYGYPFEDCKKGHIERGLDRVLEQIADGDEDPDLPLIQRVLELRLEASRTAPTKYAALQRAVDRETGVLRGAMQFAGAQRTWRWSGRMYQPQNLAKPPKYMEKYVERIADDLTVLDPWSFDQIYTTDRHMVGGKLVYSSPMDALATGVRPVAQAPEGTLLIDCDLNAVENRVLGWMTNCPKILRVFELGRDPYVDFATYLFGGEYDALWAEYKGVLNPTTGRYEGGNSFKRTISKPGVLGCLGSDTPVLTDHGWKRIVDVTKDDKVHDGTEFVAHDGVVFRGEKDLWCRSGVYATEDHKFQIEGDRWFIWQDLRDVNETWQSALDMASGRLRLSFDQGSLQVKSSDADADAGLFGKSLAEILFTASQRNVPDARLPTDEVVSARKLVPPSSIYSQIVSMLREQGARTPKISLSSITGVGEFVCGSTRLSSGLSTASKSSARMARSKLTERTTTGTMSREISDLRHVRCKTLTSGLSWDILNAGTRQSFVVLTESGPVVAHNCGYQLGPGQKIVNRDTGEVEGTGLLGYAWNMGVKEFTPEQSKLSVEVFRSTFEEVVDFWYAIERAAKKCVLTGEVVRFKMLTFDRKGPFLRMILPSGRCLHYVRPRIVERETPWGAMKDTLVYDGLNDKNQWVEIKTHGGKLTENADQAMSRDLLAHGMRIAKRRYRIDIRLHVHDQLVGIAPIAQAEEQLALLKASMEERPPWAYAIGNGEEWVDLPLGSNGFTSRVFMKD